MDHLYKLIIQIQEEFKCPVCGINYKTGEIRLKGMTDKTIIIQNICPKGHISLHVTDVVKKEDSPISLKDIKSLKENLNKFDGDFNTLWKK